MRKAIDKAREIEDRFGNDPFIVADKLGLAVLEEDLEGRLREVYFGDSIVIRRDLPSSEKRELVAHAIGHHLLHAGNHLSMQRRVYSFGNYHERQANVFAAYLLVAAEELVGALRTNASCSEIAEQFGVTEELADFRMKLHRAVADQASEQKGLRPPTDFWLEQWLRANRWYGQLKEASQEEQDFTYHIDVAYAFFQSCYHLRDWLKQCGVVENEELNAFFKDSVEMGICRNICNGAKHLTVKHPGENPEAHLENLQSIGASLAVMREHDPYATACKEKVEFKVIVLAGGKKWNALDLATECLKQWERFLSAHSLL